MRTHILAAAAAAVAVLGLAGPALAQPVGHPPRAAAAAASAAAVTVNGPHMWDPSLNGGKGGPNPAASTVTVSQTSSLVNQMVQVSWTNFTPSSALIYNASNTVYPVMVAECNTTNPSSQPTSRMMNRNSSIVPPSGSASRFRI